MKKFPAFALLLCAMLVVVVLPAMGIENPLNRRGENGNSDNLSSTLTVFDFNTKDMAPFIRVQTVFKMVHESNPTLGFLGKGYFNNHPDKSYTAGPFSPYGLHPFDPGEKIGFDQAYINIQTPLGILDIGRTETESFGTFLGGDGQIDQQIRYTLPVNDLTILAIVGQRTEKNEQKPSIKRIHHTDAYSLAGIYKMPIGVSGVMLNYDTYSSGKDLDQKAFFINPYLNVNVAGCNVSGEARYQWGNIKDGIAANPDTDISRFAANVELNMPLGPVLITTGYSFMGGDADYHDGNADHQQSFFMDETGKNRDKIWILTGDKAVTAEIFGVTDDFIKNARTYGSKLIYIGASMSPIENLDVGLLMASSRAEDVPSGMKDHHGIEWDVSLSYRLFNNVSYDFIAAFLAAGDFWKELDPALNVENSFALYQQLKLKF